MVDVDVSELEEVVTAEAPDGRHDGRIRTPTTSYKRLGYAQKNSKNKKPPNTELMTSAPKP